MNVTFAEKIARYFKARPHIWIDGKDLAEIGGGYAWRSRVSDVRRRYHMTIDNRVRRIEGADGESYCVSEYRYTPADAAEAVIEKHDANVWELRG